MTTRTKNLIAILATTIVVVACGIHMKKIWDCNSYVSTLSIRRYDTKGDAKHIGAVLNTYSSDYDDHLPPAMQPAEWQRVLKSYDKNLNFDSHNPAGGSIVPNPRVAGANLNPLKESKTVVAFEEKPWKDGKRTFLFADGTIKFLTSATTDMMGGPIR